jgi:endonuclease/exonuclease/phosphatase family metal-dependent hydrolase
MKMSAQTNTLKIISYNLKYHRASRELAGLVEDYDADVLCVQECHAEKLPDTISNLTLADKTVSGTLNLAIYYRKDRLDVIDTSSHLLKISLLEKLYMPPMERLLVTKLYDKESEQALSIGSFHATHHIASNYLRRAQITGALTKLSELSDKTPGIMVGDYNYLLFKKNLKVCIEESGYQLSLSDRPTYFMSKCLPMRFDMATSINAQIEWVRALPRGLSDHAPILINAII